MLHRHSAYGRGGGFVAPTSSGAGRGGGFVAPVSIDGVGRGGGFVAPVSTAIEIAKFVRKVIDRAIRTVLTLLNKGLGVILNLP